MTDDKTPKTLGLKQIIAKYLDFQKEVIIRRTKFDLDKIDILNKINGTRSGKKVLNELCISQNTYSIVDHTSDGLAEAHFCANDDVQGMSGGTIVTNGNNNLYTISHELFHGYQDEKGQGGNSIYNEVEAMMFEYSVMLQSGEGSTPPIKNDNEAYNSSVNNLISNYSYDNMNKVVKYNELLESQEEDLFDIVIKAKMKLKLANQYIEKMSIASLNSELVDELLEEELPDEQVEFENEEDIPDTEKVKDIKVNDIDIYYLIVETMVDDQDNTMKTGNYFLCNSLFLFL